jgi:hypothetical protein
MAKTKLTPEVKEKILSALTAGNYQEAAAAYAGIDQGTYYRWMERGRIERDRVNSGEKPLKAETIYREFREAVETARAQAEVRNTGIINKAANDGTWQAAAWYLERSHPQRWGRINRTEISGPEGGPIKTEVDLVDLEARLASALGLGTDDITPEQ